MSRITPWVGLAVLAAVGLALADCGDPLAQHRCRTDDECVSRVDPPARAGRYFHCNHSGHLEDDQGRGVCFFGIIDGGPDAAVDSGADASTDAGGDAGADSGIDAGLDAGTTKWKRVLVGTSRALNGIWGTSANDAWIVGENGTVLHWAGTSWSPAASPTAADLYAVSGATSIMAVAAGNSGVVLRWDGGSWAREDAGASLDLRAVAVSSEDLVWIAGSFGATYVWSGTKGGWSNLTGFFPANQFNGFAATSGNAAVVVGTSGSIVHWSMGVQATGVRGDAGTATADLFAVTGGSGRWAVGGGGEILRPNPLTVNDAGGLEVPWTPVPPCASSPLRGVWSSSTTNAWAVGANGTICHWDGSSWQIDPSGTSETLNAIWGPNAGELWAVGTNGTILHWTP